MRAWQVFACVALIAALGYIGVSWAVAGAGLCVFAPSPQPVTSCTTQPTPISPAEFIRKAVPEGARRLAQRRPSPRPSEAR
jgi:hypothetical protein